MEIRRKVKVKEDLNFSIVNESVFFFSFRFRQKKMSV